MVIMNIKEKIIHERKLTPKTITTHGGQSTGRHNPTMVLECETLDLKIEFGYYRSQHQNRQMLNTIHELLIDEIIK